MGKLPNFSGCFVCGDRNPAGLAVRFHVEDGRVSTVFTPREPQMGYHGSTHGGVVAALLDETMGWAPCLRRQRFCVCVRLTVEYRRPVPVGEEITVTGWVVDDSRRIWEAAGEVRDAGGAVLVRAHGRYVPVSEEQTRAVCDYLTWDEGCIPRARICPDPA